MAESSRSAAKEAERPGHLKGIDLVRDREFVFVALRLRQVGPAA